MQLLSVNEERDQLRTAFDELKQQTNIEPGNEVVGRALVQVFSVSSPISFCCVFAWLSKPFKDYFYILYFEM